MSDDTKATETAANGHVGRDFFLGQQNAGRRYKDVELGDGKRTRIRSLTEREKTGFETTFVSTSTGKVNPDSRVALICMCLVDSDGKQLFPDYREAKNQFMEMDAFLTTKIWNEVWAWVGYSQEDAERIDSFENAPVS